MKKRDTSSTTSANAAAWHASDGKSVGLAGRAVRSGGGVSAKFGKVIGTPCVTNITGRMGLFMRVRCFKRDNNRG